MDHSKYQKRMKSLSIAQLEFIIKDAQEAIVANPSNPNNGYYSDEVCYAGMEIKRRQIISRKIQKFGIFS